MIAHVITIDDSAYPAIGVASPGITYQQATDWVQQQDTPVVFPDHSPHYYQYQVAYIDESGLVQAHHLVHVADERLAVEHARRYLTGNFERYKRQ